MKIKRVALVLTVLFIYTVSHAQLPQRVEIYGWNGNWVANSTRTISYDKAGRIIEDIMDHGGYYATKKQRSYDSLGNLTKEITFNKYSGTWEMGSGSEFKYSYDGMGNILEKLTLTSQNGTWVNSLKLSSTYSGTNLLTETWQTWQSYDWYNIAKRIYTYNGDTLASSTYHDWQGGSWIALTRENNFIWHVLNELPSSYISEKNDGGWRNDSKYNISYVSNGGTITLIQAWHPDSIKWLDQIRHSLFYDKYENATETKSEFYDHNNSSWAVNFWSTYLNTYDNEDNVVEIITQKWSSADQALLNEKKEVFSNFFTAVQDDPVGEVSGYTLYPNPVKEELYLKLDKPSLKPTSIVLYDMQGRLVSNASVPATNIEVRLDLTELKEGLYFIRIEGETGAITQKLIKN